jgi:hypothetical protein
MKSKYLALVALIVLLLPIVASAQIIFPNRGGTGTSTAPTKGQVLVGNTNGTYSPRATSTLGISAGGGAGTVTRIGFTVPTGFSIAGFPITTNGTGTLSYGAGFEGFKTASGTAWQNFYATPSTRITAGDAIDWTSNTLNVITSGDWTGTFDGYEATGLLARAAHTGTQLASTISDFVATVRTSVSETITGIDYNNSTGVLSLTSGFSIPLTASTTQWQTAFGWGNHATQGYLTGNQTITLSGDVSGSGATSITTTVADDSHAHTGTTLSGIDISSDTNLAGDSEVVLTGDSLSLASSIARDSELHSAVTVSGARDYITLSGQDIVRGVVDVSDDTNLTVTATGLNLTLDAVALASGYTIPTTTLMALLGGFYNAPSARITDGTALTWSGNTLNCDTASGSIQGCLSSANWTTFNGKVASTAIDTSTEIRTLVSDETGTNRLVFSGAPAFSGTTTFAGIFATGTASTTRIKANHATTTNLGITSRLSFNGITGTTWSAFCTAITGGAGLCDGVDASGGGGGGSISTSTTPNAGNLAYWTSPASLGQVATGTLTETTTGLELNATRGLIGGSAILSLTSGYSIPTTTLLSNVGTFYNTPSNRITAGTGIDWSGSTLNTVLTAGDGLTLTAEDFDCDTASGSVFGCLTSADWTSFNGRIASSAINSLAKIETLTGVANIIIENDFDASSELLALMDDETGSNRLVFSGSPAFSGTATFSALTATGTVNIDSLNSVDSVDGTTITTIENAFDTVSAALETAIEAAIDTIDSLTISTTLVVPFGTTCDSNADGEICQDTSGNQLIVDGLAVATQDVEIWSVTVASTSGAFISSGLLPAPTRIDGFTITRIQCHVTGGTSKVIAVEDASANSSEDITCATTNTTDDGSITNSTYTASELSLIDFGATSGSVNYVSISVFGNWTRE